jgi:hypothetical protein
MRVTYKLNDRRKSARLELDSYEVLGYGVFDDKSNVFLIANDDLQIIEPDKSVLEIIDNDLSEYVQKSELNYGKDFFVHKSLLDNITGFDNYRQLKSYDIYERSKISNFFLNNNYSIPEGYRNTVLNVDYKMNLIEGFLMFANHYINNKNSVGSYWDELIFFKKETFDSIVDDKFKTDKKVKQFEASEYKLLLRNFIDKYLFDQVENENKSVDICDRLFKLIDSIFINSIDSVYIIETFYDEVFAIKYDNKYYCLNKTWGS